MISGASYGKQGVAQRLGTDSKQRKKWWKLEPNFCKRNKRKSKNITPLNYNLLNKVYCMKSTEENTHYMT